MKYLKFIALFLLLVLLTPLVALASDVSDADYYGTITVTNNSTANINVPTTFTANTTAMIAQGFLNATANNCAIQSSSGADVAFMPGYTPSGYPWNVFVPSIGGSTQINDILYTGNVSGGHIRYFPGSTGMSIDDDATMEPSDNFSLELSGFYDTGFYTANQTYANKPDAFMLRNGASGNITAIMHSNNALDFEATNTDNVSIPDSDQFTFNTGGADDPFSITGWVKPETNAGTLPIVAKYITPQNTEWMLNLSTTNQVQFILTNNDVTAFIRKTTTATLTDGNWYHIAATYDGSELVTGIQIYINTVLQTATTNTTTGAYTGMTNRVSPVTLGSARTAAGFDYFDGVQSNIKIYDQELTAAEVTDDYNGGVESDIIAWWKLIEGAGNPFDYSGHQHNATTNLADWITSGGKASAVEISIAGKTSDEYTAKAALESPFMGFAIDTTSTNITPVADNITMNAPIWQPEETGATFTSIDSTGHTLTPSGATYMSKSAGYYFDGTNDTISLGSNVSLDLGGAHTLEIVVKPTDGVNTQRLLGDGQRYNLRIASGTGLTYWYLDTGSNYRSVNKANVITPNAINHIVATRSAANLISLYVNGSPVYSQTSDFVHQGWAGTTYIASVTEDYTGYVLEARIYDTDITDAQVAQNWNAIKAKYTTGDIYTVSTLASVPNNANDWLVGYGTEALKYMDAFLFYQDGTNTCNLTWEYGTTFTDQSGSGNDGTPSFRTADASPYISAELVGFAPISEAKAPAYVLTDAPAFWTTTPSVTGNFTANTSGALYPGHGVITAIAIGGSTPEQFLTYILAAFIIILIIGLPTAYFLAKYGRGDTTLVLASVIFTAMCLGVAVRVIDVWQVYFFVIMAWGIRELEKDARGT